MEKISLEELRQSSTVELMHKALSLKLTHRGDSVSCCSIINAKSGRCSEDCRYCAQSVHYHTTAPVYPLKSSDELTKSAEQALSAGASRFSLVTSGRGLDAADLERLAESIRFISSRVDIKLCGSFGIIPHSSLLLLKNAGLVRYHHNLESSERFFPFLTTSHSYAQRVETVRQAQRAGLEVCSGGLIGLGEDEQDRLELLASLAELGVDSVPLNILIPLPGTPLAERPPLPPVEVLRTIAFARILMPDLCIRLAGGRERGLPDFLAAAFMAGADGLMVGGYLTQRGRLPEQDHSFINEMKSLWKR